MAATNEIGFYGVVLRGEHDPWTVTWEANERELGQFDTPSTASLEFFTGPNFYLDRTPYNQLLRFAGTIGAVSSSTGGNTTVGFAAAKLPVDVGVADLLNYPGFAMQNQLGPITHISDPVVKALRSKMGISFVTSTETPDVEFILTLKTQQTEQLSAGESSEGVYLYQARFKSGEARSQITLPFTDFKLTVRGREVRDAPPLVYGDDFQLTEIGFLVTRGSLDGARETRVPFDFNLTMRAPVFRVEAMIGPHEMSLIAGANFTAYQGNYLYPKGTPEAREMERLNPLIVAEYRSAVVRLHAAENIEPALAIGREGPAAIERELNRLGLIEDKITSLEPISGVKLTGQWFNLLTKKGFPVEEGFFSKFHGAYSHHLQMIAMSQGLSPLQLASFKDTIKRMFENSAYWRDLNFLVDNYDTRLPSSPEFWNTRLPNLITPTN